MYIILDDKLNVVENLPARLVLAYFLGMCKSCGEVHTTYSSISQKLGISERSVGTACRLLVSYHLLDVTKMFGGVKIAIPHDFNERLVSFKNCIIQKLNDTKIEGVSFKNCTSILQKLHDTPYIYYNNNIECNIARNPSKIEGYSDFEGDEWSDFCEQWQHHWQQVRGCGYVVDGNFTDNGRKLLRKIKAVAADNFEITTVADALTKMYNAADTWQRQNWSIQLINKQFNQIYARTKNKIDECANIAASIDF